MHSVLRVTVFERHHCFVSVQYMNITQIQEPAESRNICSIWLLAGFNFLLCHLDSLGSALIRVCFSILRQQRE